MQVLAFIRKWNEKKISPDEWNFTYSVNKKRAWSAPEGSGVPVGTEYHWYILADQIVKKIDANTCATEMSGLQYKVAHKRAGLEKWNIADRAQKRRLVELLERQAAKLKDELNA